MAIFLGQKSRIVTKIPDLLNRVALLYNSFNSHAFLVRILNFDPNLAGKWPWTEKNKKFIAYRIGSFCQKTLFATLLYTSGLDSWEICIKVFYDTKPKFEETKWILWPPLQTYCQNFSILVHIFRRSCILLTLIFLVQIRENAFCSFI